MKRTAKSPAALADSADDATSDETTSDGTERNGSGPDATLPEESVSLDNSAHIVPLFPLALALVVGNLLAIVLFAWSRIRLLKPQAQNSHPPSQ